MKIYIVANESGDSWYFLSREIATKFINKEVWDTFQSIDMVETVEDGGAVTKLIAENNALRRQVFDLTNRRKFLEGPLHRQQIEQEYQQALAKRFSDAEGDCIDGVLEAVEHNDRWVDVIEKMLKALGLMGSVDRSASRGPMTKCAIPDLSTTCSTLINVDECAICEIDTEYGLFYEDFGYICNSCIGHLGGVIPSKPDPQKENR